MNAILFALAINLINGWNAYVAPTRDHVHISSCGDCSLDDDEGMTLRHDSSGDRQMTVFAKVRDGVVERVRILPQSCTPGQQVHRIEGVSRDESIAFLRGAVDHGSGRAREGALLALSLHEGATDVLIDLARNSPNREIRGKALFWLSQQAGRKAADALKDAVDNDPEDSIKSKAVFGISQLPDDESIPLLVDLVKHHKSTSVRKKAAFWLGQKNDPRALAAIEEILKN